MKAILFLFFIQSTFACQYFDKLKKLSSQKGSTIIEQTRIDLAESREREKISAILVEHFFNGQFQFREISECQIENRELFIGTLYGRLIEKSLELLNKSNNIEMRTLYRKYFNLVGVGAVGIIGVQTNSVRAGAYHITTKSIFLNTVQVSVDKWMLFFSHELLHYVDDKLPASLTFLNNEGNRIRAEELSKKDSLTKEEIAFLEKWVYHSMNVNILAEHRAWMGTIKIYQANPKRIIVPWMELILNSKPKGTNLDKFMFKYLFDRSLPISDEIFNRPNVKEIVEKLVNSNPYAALHRVAK